MNKKIYSKYSTNKNMYLCIKNNMGGNKNFTFTTSAFENNQIIPDKYTKYNDNKTPYFEWIGVPDNAKDLMLLCYDKDAVKVVGKIWVHWFVYNIDIDTRELVDGKYKVGINDFKNKQYDGPKPPDENTHHYEFTLYALNKVLDIDSNTHYEYNDIMKMIDGNVISKITINGNYKKRYNYYR